MDSLIPDQDQLVMNPEKQIDPDTRANVKTTDTGISPEKKTHPETGDSKEPHPEKEEEVKLSDSDNEYASDKNPDMSSNTVEPPAIPVEQTDPEKMGENPETEDTLDKEMVEPSTIPVEQPDPEKMVKIRKHITFQ